MSLYKELGDMQVLESMESNAQYVALSSDDCSTLLAEFLMENVGLDGILEALDEADETMSAMESSMVGYDDVMERTIVKLDKKAKKNQTYKIAIFTVARNANDPDYKKLVTLWQVEKYLTRKLEKKHMAKAKAYMKEMKKQAASKVNSATKSIKNHPVVKKMTSALTRSEKETKKARKLGGAPKSVNKGKNIIQQLSSKLPKPAT